jgi:modification methylase
LFGRRNAAITAKLAGGLGGEAFELMHRELFPVWDTVYRVLKPGGFACINIGDATRTIDSEFCLYANHARILQYLSGKGFSALPDILWRKQTNAPTKFMGSGMLPAGAYVTLEHEYILIVRKGIKRVFKTGAEQENRRRSAIFWEERNEWYSDVWTDLKWAVQDLGEKRARTRSAAFPFELAYRLINMYSVRGDAVLDPFAGTGTVMAAAMAAGRDSVNVEIEPALLPLMRVGAANIVSFANRRIERRLAAHLAFVRKRTAQGRPMKYTSRFYGFPVVTNQEKAIFFDALERVDQTDGDTWMVTYDKTPHVAPDGNSDATGSGLKTESPAQSIRRSGQLRLFDDQ